MQQLAATCNGMQPLVPCVGCNQLRLMMLETGGCAKTSLVQQVSMMHFVGFGQGLEVREACMQNGHVVVSFDIVRAAALIDTQCVLARWFFCISTQPGQGQAAAAVPGAGFVHLAGRLRDPLVCFYCALQLCLLLTGAVWQRTSALM